MEKLRELARDGLLVIEEDWLTVTPKGRLLIRNICMVFDRYLTQARANAAPDAVQPLRYSKTV